MIGIHTQPQLRGSVSYSGLNKDDKRKLDTPNKLSIYAQTSTVNDVSGIPSGTEVITAFDFFNSDGSITSCGSQETGCNPETRSQKNSELRAAVTNHGGINAASFGGQLDSSVFLTLCADPVARQNAATNLVSFGESKSISIFELDNEANFGSGDTLRINQDNFVAFVSDIMDAFNTSGHSDWTLKIGVMPQWFLGQTPIQELTALSLDKGIQIKFQYYDYDNNVNEFGEYEPTVNPAPYHNPDTDCWTTYYPTPIKLAPCDTYTKMSFIAQAIVNGGVHPDDVSTYLVHVDTAVFSNGKNTIENSSGDIRDAYLKSNLVVDSKTITTAWGDEFAATPDNLYLRVHELSAIGLNVTLNDTTHQVFLNDFAIWNLQDFTGVYEQSVYSALSGVVPTENTESLLNGLIDTPIESDGFRYVNITGFDQPYFGQFSAYNVYVTDSDGLNIKGVGNSLFHSDSGSFFESYIDTYNVVNQVTGYLENLEVSTTSSSSSSKTTTDALFGGIFGGLGFVFLCLLYKYCSSSGDGDNNKIPDLGDGGDTNKTDLGDIELSDSTAKGGNDSYQVIKTVEPESIAL